MVVQGGSLVQGQQGDPHPGRCRHWTTYTQADQLIKSSLTVQKIRANGPGVHTLLAIEYSSSEIKVVSTLHGRSKKKEERKCKNRRRCLLYCCFLSAMHQHSVTTLSEFLLERKYVGINDSACYVEGMSWTCESESLKCDQNLQFGAVGTQVDFPFTLALYSLSFWLILLQYTCVEFCSTVKALKLRLWVTPLLCGGGEASRCRPCVERRVRGPSGCCCNSAVMFRWTGGGRGHLQGGEDRGLMGQVTQQLIGQVHRKQRVCE